MSVMNVIFLPFSIFAICEGVILRPLYFIDLPCWSSLSKGELGSLNFFNFVLSKRSLSFIAKEYARVGVWCFIGDA